MIAASAARAIAAFGCAAVVAAASAAAAESTRAQQEAAFMRTVNAKNTPSAVTGDLAAMAGTHVAYTCQVDRIVRDGIILGNCGGEIEPVDLFIELATAHIRVGERLRILGILDRPASWSDATGHTVYYAFLRAVFADPLAGH